TSRHSAAPTSYTLSHTTLFRSYLMTGWRCGYIAMNSGSKKLAALREDIPKLARVRIASNLPVQIAAVQALRGPQTHIPKMVEKRSEEHTSELQSRFDIVCRLLL